MEPSTTAPDIEYAPSLPSIYLIHPSDFLVANPHIQGLLASAVVFHPSSWSNGGNPPRTLLVRRAATDSWPLLWEMPGGSVDVPDDASLAGAAVRELREETGLRGTRVLGAVRPNVEELLFTGFGDEDPSMGWNLDEASGLCTFIETGRRWARATVAVAVACEPGSADDTVVLQPEEHSEAAWVTEDEVWDGYIRVGDERKELKIVSEGVKQTLLAAFRLWRETDGWRDAKGLDEC
ncbi:hypothetical protein HJFPF1_11841 [Paramyrothecium foliicola]|nr:hypothetical protein HJFPF1_11841 [Paramyrothecium foliicola]